LITGNGVKSLKQYDEKRSSGELFQFSGQDHELCNFGKKYRNSLPNPENASPFN